MVVEGCGAAAEAEGLHEAEGAWEHEMLRRDASDDDGWCCVRAEVTKTSHYDDDAACTSQPQGKAPSSNMATAHE
jgi:hypothetical protein